MKIVIILSNSRRMSTSTSRRNLDKNTISASDINCYSHYYSSHGKFVARGYMKYSKIVLKKHLDEWLKVYENGESGPVYCSRTSERKTAFTFSNIKPRISPEDMKLIGDLHVHYIPLL